MGGFRHIDYNCFKTKRDSKGNIDCCTIHLVVEEFTSKVAVDHSATCLLVFSKTFFKSLWLHVNLKLS